MAHRLILVLSAFTLSEALSAQVISSSNENADLKVVWLEYFEPLGKLQKRQAEDFGPPDDFGNPGPSTGDNSRNRTGDRPGDRRGGSGRRRHRPRHSSHGCHLRGKHHKRPQSNETEEVALVGQVEYRGVNELSKDFGVSESQYHGSNGRKYHRRGSEECKEGSGIDDSGTSTAAPRKLI